MQIEIRCLLENEGLIRTVAQWMFEQWGQATESASPEAFIPGLRQRTHCGSIPFTLVAFHDSEPIGTASLFFQDMDTHTHLCPWMSAIYVDPGFRSRGIGRRLCADVVMRARSLSVQTLYLFTPDKTAFYRHMDWKPIEITTYRNETVTIMRRLL